MESFEQQRDANSNTEGEIRAEIQVVPLIEERVEITKKVIEKARVKVSKTVKEKTETYNIPLFSDEIVVKRVPKNEIVDIIPTGVRYEGETMIIPVLKEVAVVEKRIMLVEEIHVIKNKHQRTDTQEVTTRNEEVQVERTEILPPKPV